MTNKISFLEEEIPYDKLEKLGITRRDFLSMPKELVDPIINGKVSPIIKARVRTRYRKVMEIPMKIQLTRDDDGSVKLQTYQRTKEVQNDLCLTPLELERVKKGDVIRKELEKDGIRKMKFVQLDGETNALISRSVAHTKIAEKLRDMEKINDIELGTNQKQAAQEGKPIELNVGGQPVTVGVDLREPQGFKVVNGDMEEWDRQKKIKFDLENEGYMGYIQSDKNGWEYRHYVDEQTGVTAFRNKSEKKSSGLKL